jgi:3-hydroxyisobutyrate dehydrogenase-like beta-hydroxyacid dehydrogenase
MATIGLLNPGEMGSMVGAAVRSAGGRVLWAGEGRSAATRKRASDAGLEDAGSVASVVRASEVILSVCPPHAAVDVATQVAALRFGGTYVDGNAVSPATAREIGGIVEKGGARFVDGGIIGPPPVKPGSTRFYVSGTSAERIAALLTAGPLQAIVVPGGPGAASAVKMAYASWTKGSAALLLAVCALASAEGVEDSLVREWKI